MAERKVTVSDLVELIAAREEMRAELQKLSEEAYQRWRAFECQLHALEARFDRASTAVSEVRIRVAAQISTGSERKAG